MRGQYMQAVESGRQVDDATWSSCRIVLTNRRLVLVADGKTSVPLADVDEVGGRYGVDRRVPRTLKRPRAHVPV